MNQTNLKSQRMALAILALAVALTGCNKGGKLTEHSTYTPPAGPVELKLKWPTGERVVQDMDMTTKSAITLPGQAAPRQQDMTMGQKYALTVLQETPDGGHEVELEFLGARMAMEMGGKSLMNYDSAKSQPGDSNNPVAAIFGQLTGSKLQFYLDGSNNVNHIDGIPELVDRLSAGKTAASMVPLKSMFNEGYFKQMMSSSRFLPPGAVSPGDTWPVQMEVAMEPIGTFVQDYTFTFAGWEMHGVRKCARLEFQGSIKIKPDATPNPMGLTMAIQNGTVSGVSWFDPELGIIIDTEMNQDMTMNMTMPANPRAAPGAGGQPQKITSQLSQVIKFKLDSVQ